MVITLASLLTSCAATTITASWRDEAYQKQPRKALVMLVTERDTVKRFFENDFVAQLRSRGVDAVPGYTVLPPTKKLERQEIVSRLNEVNADSLFMTRIVDKKTYQAYYPGSVYATAPGYYRHNWHDQYSRSVAYHGQGYAYQQEVVYTETQMYDVETERLVWSVMTETYIESTVEKEIKSFVKVIMKSLSKKGLVPKP